MKIKDRENYSVEVEIKIVVVGKGTREFSGIREIFYTLIVFVFIWICAFIKTQYFVHISM